MWAMKLQEWLRLIVHFADLMISRFMDIRLKGKLVV